MPEPGRRFHVGFMATPRSRAGDVSSGLGNDGGPASADGSSSPAATALGFIAWNLKRWSFVTIAPPQSPRFPVADTPGH